MVNKIALILRAGIIGLNRKIFLRKKESSDEFKAKVIRDLLTNELPPNVRMIRHDAPEHLVKVDCSFPECYEFVPETLGDSDQTTEII